MFLNLTIVDLSINEWFYLRTVRAIAKARKIVQISICVFDLQRYVYVILSKIKMTVSFLKECYSFSGVSLYLWWCIVEKKVKVKFTFEMISYDDSLFCKDRWIFHLTSIQLLKEKKWWNFEKDRHCLIQLASIDLMLVFA